ncbi:MAG: hypothetical protein IT443_09215 [Phycisphaeraceae bacterium]|nr:hypothetical protein [Phycisphaeraceae bacterium]
MNRQVAKSATKTAKMNIGSKKTLIHDFAELGVLGVVAVKRILSEGFGVFPPVS